MATCSYIKRDGVKCSRKAKYEDVCGTHKNTRNLLHDCPICFYELKANKIIKLSCGHLFHIDCLAKCKNKQCPLCRQFFGLSDCMHIYKDTIITPMMTEIFSESSREQEQLLNTIESVININDFIFNFLIFLL